jgi:hypothetical protein
MKKKFNFLILLFMTSASNHIFSQKLSGNCQYKEKTREFCKAVDTLSRFMDNIKKNSTEGAWAHFMEDAALGSVAAFNNFGDQGKELKNTFDILGNDLDKNSLGLISAVDPGNRLTGEQLRDAIVSQVVCYYADTIENDLEKLMKEGGIIMPGGGPVPNRFAGPCETSLRNCVSAAASNHTTQLIACGFGTGNIIRFIGGWWGLGAGLVCLAGVENTYNNAKWTCLENYCDCANCAF